jgi:hypothetical protein
MVIDRFYSTRDETIHEHCALREVAKDIGARQRLFFEQYGREADTVGFGAIWMKADVTYLKVDGAPVEQRKQRFAVASRGRRIG